jgi:outer membrane protein assembly factor BamB
MAYTQRKCCMPRRESSAWRHFGVAYNGLIAVVSTLALIAAADPVVVDVAEAERIGWPQSHGPNADRLPLRCGVPLLRDLSLAQLRWDSASRDLGRGKTGSQSFRNYKNAVQWMGEARGVHAGSWSGVVVADGRVFGASMRPAVLPPAPPGSPERLIFEGEDVVVAIDADTGATLWTAAEPGGLMWTPGKRGGLQVTPVVAGGRVVAVGSTGRLMAYDAVTGSRVWMTVVDPGMHAHLMAELERVRGQTTETAAERLKEPGTPGWEHGLVVADDLVVFTNERGCMRAFALADGALVWQHTERAVGRYATPTLWRHDGKTWLVTASDDGVLRLTDARSGDVRWQLTGLAKNHSTLGIGEDMVLALVPGTQPPNARNTPGRWAAWRLSLDGATPLWQTPDDVAWSISTWNDNSGHQRAVVRDGRVYLGASADKTALFGVLDMHTGQVLQQCPVNSVGMMFTLVEDLLIGRSDPSHSSTGPMRKPIYACDPERLQQLGGPGRSGLDLQEQTIGYQGIMEWAVVAGRIYERNKHGGVSCYDLRRPDGAVRYDLELDGTSGGPVRCLVAADGRILSGSQYNDGEWRPRRVSGDRTQLRLEPRFPGMGVTHELSFAEDAGMITGQWRSHVPAAGWKAAAGAVIGAEPTTDGSWSLRCDQAMLLSGHDAGHLDLRLTRDAAGKVTGRLCAAHYNTAWSPIDGSSLTWNETGVSGRISFVVLPDAWVRPRPDGDGVVAGVLTLQALGGGGQTTGTWEVDWSQDYERAGAIHGTMTATSL